MAVLDPSDVQAVALEENVVFGHGGGRELLCDIYRPSPQATKRTAVIHLHGGGFRAGSKAGARLARPLAVLGYTCVSASYRLLPERWPAQLEDVKSAISWTRKNASDLGVEPDKLVLLGYSAGGYLALVTSAQPDTQVAACVAFYAPARMAQGHPLGGPSPVEQLKAGYPPTMLLHGTADKTVSVDGSLDLYARLNEVNVPVELHVVEGVTHIFDTHTDFAEASAVWIDLFLDRHVVNPRVYPSTEPAPRPA
jgi:acetyl esterase/lipase